MKYSEYQEALFSAIADLDGNIMVRALAGSGKSTTIEHAIARIPQSKRVLVLAFNKHIADAMRARLPAGVEVSTCNSFGNKCLYGRVGKLNANKVRNLLLYRVLGMDNLEGKAKSEAFKMVKPITQLVALLRAHAAGDISMWEELVKKYAVEVPECADFQGILNETWNLTVGDSRVIDFDDQIYIPVMQNLIPANYDYVFIDEAQDLNYCQMKFVMAAGARGRIIAVGDEHQAIYGFRGADTDAIKTFEKMLNGISLPLSICYRCSKAVIKEAQTIVPDIECADTAPEGEVRGILESQLAETLVENDWVLCRTTAPLVSMCMKMIRKGHKAVVKGRDIGEQLAQLINQLGPPSTPTDGFLPILESYLERETARLKKAGRDEELISVEDRVETIRCLIEDTETIADVLVRISTIFSDDRAAIMFCTVHRSKGLESERIFIMRPDLLPHPKAKLEWQLLQEENLHYVAITRAREILTYVYQDKDGLPARFNADSDVTEQHVEEPDYQGEGQVDSDSGIPPTNVGSGDSLAKRTGPDPVVGDTDGNERDDTGPAPQSEAVNLIATKVCACCGQKTDNYFVGKDLNVRCLACIAKHGETMLEIEASDAGIKFAEQGKTLSPYMQEVLKRHGYL